MADEYTIRFRSSADSYRLLYLAPGVEFISTRTKEKAERFDRLQAFALADALNEIVARKGGNPKSFHVEKL